MASVALDTAAPGRRSPPPRGAVELVDARALAADLEKLAARAVPATSANCARRWRSG